MKIFSRSVLALALASLWSSPSLAQEEKTFQLEEVVVTAQKKSQGLQDIPVAVSVINGSDISARGAVDVYDLASVAPSLVISRDKGSANIYIRGVGNAFVNMGVDGSVAVHQDNVYLSRPRGQVASFYDIERIEVLRGPQGTLYGSKCDRWISQCHY